MNVYFTIAEGLIGCLGPERCLACMEEMQAKAFDVTCAWEKEVRFACEGGLRCLTWICRIWGWRVQHDDACGACDGDAEVRFGGSERVM